MKKPLWEGFFSAPERRNRFPREEKSAEAGRTRGKTPRKRPAPRMSGITRMFRRCMAHGRRRKRLCCPHGSGRKPGKGRTMPRGKTGKAPQPEKARTSAPAEEKTLSNIRIPFPAGLKSPPAQRKPWKAAPPAPHKQKTSGTGAETGNAGKRWENPRRPESLGKRRAPSPKGKAPWRHNARLKKRC